MRLLQTQESVNPYQSILAPTNNVAAEVPCKAVLMNSAKTVTCTFADGTSASLSLGKGIHKLALTTVSSNTDLFFLY